MDGNATGTSPAAHGGDSSGAVLARIRMVRPSLTPSEGSVAQLISSQPRSVVTMGIEGLSKAANVSTASVTRFCQRLGYSGFKDFKIALVSEIGNAVAVLPEALGPADSPINIARNVFLADVRAIEETLELLDGDVLARAVDRLHEATEIQVYGVGSSAPIAEDAYYRFLRIGLPAHVVTDSHMQAVSASLLSPGKVAFAISHTGRTGEVLTAATNAKEAGATVIGLTSFANAPLAEIADDCIVTATGESAFRIEAMASRIAHLSVIDALYVALALRRPDQALHIIDSTNRIIESKRS